jgi:alpha-glucosidase (family GH31 glycosyl hydrolase)
MKAANGRIFAGLVNGGPSSGFTDENLMIEMLDPAAPVKEWRPSSSSGANLKGTYPSLDCYTIPAKCAASNQNRMEKGLLSRDGWAVWDDIDSLRMTIERHQGAQYSAAQIDRGGNSFKQWHYKNNRSLTTSDLYFFGHGLQFKAVLQDFLQISGPPGMLSAADYGLWWSNSFQFTKEQFLDRIISNFTKHGLPFTHLVMDFGWHQWQDGR